jgi:glycosyltransferase involved in cell wall biosynthesis
MKLVVLSNDYGANAHHHDDGVVQGGTEVFAREISSRLVSDGHTWIGFVHEKSAGACGSSVIARNKQRAYISIQLPNDFSGRLLHLDHAVAPRLLYRKEIEFMKVQIKKCAPDIVFLNGFYLFPWIMFEAAVELGIPTVVQHAGVWAKEIRQYKDKYSSHARVAAYWIERRSAQCADANVFLNETSRDAFMSALRITAVEGSEIIPLPHAGWKFMPTVRRNSNDLVLGCVARWDRIKNHEGLLAFAAAARALNMPWKFVSVTHIPNTATNAHFKQQYKNTIQVIPQMSREDLKKFYSTVDVMVVPSHFETGPFIVMEAAARGVPTLISPHVGWASEYEKRGMEKWIVRFDRPYAAVRSLRDLMKRDKMPETTKFAKWLEMGHSPDTVYQSYLRLFRRCSSSRRA